MEDKRCVIHILYSSDVVKGLSISVLTFEMNKIYKGTCCLLLSTRDYRRIDIVILSLIFIKTFFKTQSAFISWLQSVILIHLVIRWKGILVASRNLRHLN